VSDLTYGAARSGKADPGATSDRSAMQPSLPPGPSFPSPIQGVGIWSRPYSFLERCRARYGKRFTIRFPFSPPFVLISEPDQVKEVFTAPPDVLHPGEGSRVLEPLVGRHSVILLDEDPHMEQRKLMLPAFHGERMERLADLVTEVSEQEIGRWETAEPIELYPRLQALTLEVILRAVFGLDPGPRLDTLRERLSTLLAFGDSPVTLLPEPPKWLLKLTDRTGPLKGFMRIRDDVDRLMFEQIAERRQDGKDRDDVLATLLAAKHEDDSPMSDEEIRDELITLLAAGHETTASTLAWAFERLAREHAVRRRLIAEIDSGDDDAYLTATIQETLRRRPVLPNTEPRLVKRPVEVGGWLYPEGCALVANGWLVHHDPDLYPDPFAFRPERFLDEPPGTYTWIPFGGGRRRCLGAGFAMLEMTVVLPAVLRAYEVEAAGGPPEPARRRNITVRPGRGTRVSLAKRSVRTRVAA
jgi:cytochrome P450